MLLCTRNNSNTAKNIINTRKCSLNFIEDSKKHFKEAVRLGYPGDTPQEKMAKCSFTLEEGLVVKETNETRPLVVKESYQVFECTWMNELDGADKDIVREEYAPPYHDFNGITSPMGAHFILRIDKILMKEKFANAIIKGVTANAFPAVPVDYGYRDNVNFWYTAFKKPRKEPIPNAKAVDVSVVVYAAERIDPSITFTEEACATLVKVPRVFLKTILNACVKWAKENNVTQITPEHMQIINDKRNQEKS